MNVIQGTIEGCREIGANKLRSTLTISGVVLGVAALMAMFAITEGIARGNRAFFEKLGGLAKVNITRAPVPEEQQAFADMSPGITYQDAVAIRRSAPLVKLVSPEMTSARMIEFQGKRLWKSIFGVEDGFLEVDNYELGQGRFFKDLDRDKRMRVCVVGSQLGEALTGNENMDLLGEKVLIDQIPFHVVGLLEPRGHSYWDEIILIPFLTYQETMNGGSMKDGVFEPGTSRLGELNIKVRDLNYFDEALQQVRNILEQTHYGVQDFGFQTREDWFEKIEEQTFSARLSGGVIAGVSLLVGAVGITNIMLASIKQRIREIGIRLAVGARGRDIFAQIILETVILATLGGVLGVATGWGFIQLLMKYAPSSDPPVILMEAVVLSFSASVGVGILSGVIPALRAMQISPIEALKYE